MTLAAIPPIKLIAQVLRFESKIDFRRRELAPRPLLGGIGIFIATFVANAAFNILPWSLVLPGLALVILGMVDDRLQINARLKLFCEIAAVALWLAMTPSESLLLVKLGLPMALAFALHAFWVIGLTNAFNMIDGMDGLASGMAIFGFAFLGIFLPAEMRWFAWSYCAGCAAHLFYNRPPAAIFLGDSGSLLLGFLMSALGSTIAPSILHPTSVLIPLFILAHPEIDAILAMARRKRAGTPLFQGDKDHIHHKLKRIGLSPYGCLGVTYFASFYCGMTAVLLDTTSGWQGTGTAVFIAITGLGSLLAGVYYTEHRLATQSSQVGSPLLQRHIRSTSEPAMPTGPFKAVVFDLLPYYKELQERGISHINTFVVDFAEWINTTFKGAQIIPAGAYSVIVITSDFNREEVLKEFKKIVSHYQVLKNDVGIPWGLHFFTDQTDAQVFERKFASFLRKPVVESVKAA